MKRIFLPLLFLISKVDYGQTNLVPNPSFENYLIDSCPDYLGQMSRAIGWYASMETPDYFNACSTDTFPSGQHIVNVPLNWAGYRTPASGNGYSGIIARWAYTDALKEAIGAQLITPLQIGVKYYASFKVSLGGEANRYQWCGINKIGILFSNVRFDNITPAPTCSNCAQIYSDSIITDTLKWTRITGTFIADSAYSFINIGRFNFNSLTDSIQIVGNECNAYYFIDDVCVSVDSAYTWNYIYTEIIKVNKNKFINYFPNPAKDFITIEFTEVSIDEIRIFNAMGELVRSINMNNSKSIVVNLNGLSPGIYNLVAYSKNNNYLNFKLIKL